MLAAGGCARTGEITAGGISAVRSACPRVGVTAGTGDITLFNPPASREASAIDVTATLTNLQSTCVDSLDPIVTTVTFDVLARRAQPGPAREVTLPYYLAIVRGGSSVVAKTVNQVTLRFEEGQIRAQTRAQVSGSVAKSAATLPEEVRKKLTERRKAGDEAAAMDPLSTPEVRDAVLAATFEALVGFQLTQDQLKYNATR
nr:hypothetical protein [Sphingomonas sp. IC-56]